jgi:hypothetical protein
MKNKNIVSDTSVSLFCLVCIPVLSVLSRYDVDLTQLTFAGFGVVFLFMLGILTGCRAVYRGSTWKQKFIPFLIVVMLCVVIFFGIGI